MRWGLVIAAVGVGAVLLALGGEQGMTVLFVFASLLVLVPAVQSVLYARRAWAGLSRPLADDRGGAGR
jgi:hypothetical protein